MGDDLSRLGNLADDVKMPSLSNTGSGLEGIDEECLSSSDWSRDPASSTPKGVVFSAPTGDDANLTNLTENALKQLDLASSGARKGKPSSTGGTTANTRPTDLADVPELGDLIEMAELPAEARPKPRVEGVSFAVPEYMPQGTPPPVPEGLPVVSLQDIAVMEQKGLRGLRVKSRRGSTTASHASLSAIPENLEITPLHARTERSDSLRERVSHSQHGVNRLEDVQELEVEVKSNVFVNTTRSSHLESPRSSISILTSGDDSVMPHQIVEEEYELHMPILPHPRAYWRYPNATEAYRGTSSSARLALSSQSVALSSALSSFSDCGMHCERVLTDDASMQLLGSTVTYNGSTSRDFSAEELKLEKSPELCDGDLGSQRIPEVHQGTLQQETIRFTLPEAAEGLRCVKKYAVGELCWEQVVVMGDFGAGDHEFSFCESEVPIKLLNLGQYRMKTVFMDAHGKYLWAGLHNFQVVKPAEEEL